MDDTEKTSTLPDTVERLSDEQVLELRKALDDERTKSKSLNRELARARKRMEDQTDTRTQLDALGNRVGELLSLFAANDNIPDEHRAKALKMASETNTASSAGRLETYYRDLIGDALDGTDLEWEDDALESARDLWNNGKLHDSLRATMKATKAAPKEKSDKTVEQQVEALLKKSGVRVADLKEGAASGSGRGVTRADYRSVKLGSVRDMQKELDNLEDRYYKK